MIIYLQIEYILNEVGIAIVAHTIAIAIVAVGAALLGYGISKIPMKPLKNFWKPFLRDGGIIVIPPYPKNHPDFSVKSGTGYSDCIAAGEIRKSLALLGKNIEVKEEISDYCMNLIVIGGPISNPAFSEVVEHCKNVKDVEPSIVFRDHDIVDMVNGKEYPCNENIYGYCLLYLYKDLWKEKKTVILIAGCHGSDTRKFGEILTTKGYIKKINRDWKKRNYVPTAFMLKYLKKGDTSPKDIVEICRDFQIV